MDINLGAPLGILEATVVDANTHAPVPTARVILHRDNPESMYSTTLSPDGKFLFALPPAPIDIVVEAPGYRAWHYSDPQMPAHKIVMDRSDHKVITIELTPN